MAKLRRCCWRRAASAAQRPRAPAPAAEGPGRGRLATADGAASWRRRRPHGRLAAAALRRLPGRPRHTHVLALSPHRPLLSYLQVHHHTRRRRHLRPPGGRQGCALLSGRSGREKQSGRAGLNPGASPWALRKQGPALPCDLCARVRVARCCQPVPAAPASAHLRRVLRCEQHAPRHRLQQPGRTGKAASASVGPQRASGAQPLREAGAGHAAAAALRIPSLHSAHCSAHPLRHAPRPCPPAGAHLAAPS